MSNLGRADDGVNDDGGKNGGCDDVCDDGGICMARVFERRHDQLGARFGQLAART
jgi:hypothetical protein